MGSFGREQFYAPDIVEGSEEEETQEYELMREILEEIKALVEKALPSEEFDKRLIELREQAIKEYPKHGLLIETLFGVKDVAWITRLLNEYRNQRKKWTGEERLMIREKLLEITEWHYTVTELIKNFQGNREFVQDFWRRCFDVYGLFSERREEVEGIKRGVIGQVGVYNLLRSSGLEPRLASPRDDAFNKTDLVCHLPTESLAVQAKYTRRIEEPIIEVVETDSIALPPFEIQEKEGRRTYISSKDMEEIDGLRASCKRISRETGERVGGLYIVIPEGSFDVDTGEINDKLLQKLQRELEQKISQKKRQATIEDLKRAWGVKK